MRPAFRLIALCALLTLPVAAQSTLQVPGQFTTVLAALIAAQNGDTIEVGPGTYPGFIEFFGKDVTVVSTDGPEVTILDGSSVSLAPVCFIAGEGASSVLDGFTITGGSVFNGGGIFCSASVSPTVRNCILRENLGFNQGGAVFVGANSSPRFENCVFENNLSGSGLGGTAFVAAGASPTFTHCTLAGNGQPVGNPTDTGGIFIDPAGTVTLESSIVWGNSDAVFSDPSLVTANFCIIEGGDGMGMPFAGTMNLDVDPLFVDLANGDVRLAAGSPAIDAANNGLVGLPATDAIGSPRAIGGTPDIGALEFLTLFPGSGLDLELRVGVNGPENLVPERSLTQGDGLLITLDSPAATYAGAIPVIFAQFFATASSAPGNPAGFPEIWVDPAQPIALLYDGNNAPVFGIGILPPNGLTLGFVVPPGFAGQSAHVQGLVLVSNPQNGIFTAANAIRLDFN